MIASPLHENDKKSLSGRVFLLTVAVLLISTLCSPAAAARDVKVALTDLKPSLYTDDQGKPVGFFVDIIEDIAAKEGWNVIWVRGSLSESWGRLASKEIDLLPGVATTPEREKVYDFNHEPAFSVWSQVYARPRSEINTILDIDGKRVVVLKGDISGNAFRDYARKFNINATYVEKDTPVELFSATAAGEADALVVFNTAGLEDARIYGLSATPVMFNPTQIGFAVPKEMNQDLLAVIDLYISEGKGNPSSTYSQAMQKWFGIKAGSGIPVYIWWGLVTVAAIAVLFVVMSAVLRRQVRRKTAELSRQNEELQKEVASRQRAEADLVRKNEELHGAYEQLTATEEILRRNYLDLHMSEQALMQARKKLNLLNTLTFREIQNGIFSLTGYIQLAKEAGSSEKAQAYLGKGGEILRSVENSLHYTKKYQDLGISQPQWQNVNYVLINAISHLDLPRISRTVDLDDLEIYADPLLEDVFLTLMENVLIHGVGATEVNISYRQNADSITILVRDNGPGIPTAEKEKIFEWGSKGEGATGLSLAREILSITGIFISETGEPGTGARFEITVPEGGYRISAGNSAPRSLRTISRRS
jgi:ABC-type amino acid transport substrate-binding protein